MSIATRQPMCAILSEAIDRLWEVEKDSVVHLLPSGEGQGQLHPVVRDLLRQAGMDL
jgi:hypothetical protein